MLFIANIVLTLIYIKVTGEKWFIVDFCIKIIVGIKNKAIFA